MSTKSVSMLVLALTIAFFSIFFIFFFSSSIFGDLRAGIPNDLYIERCKEPAFFEKYADYCLSSYVSLKDTEYTILEQQLREVTRRAEVDNYFSNISLRKIAFSIHYAASVLVFFLVSAVVLCGLLMSWQQLKASLRGPSETERQPVTTDERQTVLKVVGMFELRTSLVGVVVLAFSLFFFNRYLEVVYPVMVLDRQELSREGNPSTDSDNRASETDEGRG